MLTCWTNFKKFDESIVGLFLTKCCIIHCYQTQTNFTPLTVGDQIVLGWMPRIFCNRKCWIFRKPHSEIICCKLLLLKCIHSACSSFIWSFQKIKQKTMNSLPLWTYTFCKCECLRMLVLFFGSPKKKKKKNANKGN